MPEKSFLLRLSGAFLIGFIAVIIALALVFTFSAGILGFFGMLFPFLIGSLLFLFAVIVIAALNYIFVMLGVVIYYLFKPMHVSTKSKGYSLEKSKEAGRRQKGKSKKRK